MTNDDKMMTQKSEKSEQIFYCDVCDYSCSRKNDFSKHKFTRKHTNDDKMMTNDDKMMTKSLKSLKKSEKKYSCECGKEYAYRQGLSVHKKKCKMEDNTIQPNSLNDMNFFKNMILEMVKTNSELQKSVIEVCRTGNNKVLNQNSHNTNNSHNKTFNLQVFLNETCKNAMNIMDFVDSIQLQLSDLEKVGQLGYIDGISDIIIKNLKALDVTERPVHCSDTKREIIYVKDENKWEKENAESEKIRKAIKRVAHKNIELIPEWRDKFPDCVYSDSKRSDQYNHIVIEAMGGDYKADKKDSENKIIKKIAKEVVIEK